MPTALNIPIYMVPPPLVPPNHIYVISILCNVLIHFRRHTFLVYALHSRIWLGVPPHTYTYLHTQKPTQTYQIYNIYNTIISTICMPYHSRYSNRIPSLRISYEFSFYINELTLILRHLMSTS